MVVVVAAAVHGDQTPDLLRVSTGPNRATKIGDIK